MYSLLGLSLFLSLALFFRFLKNAKYPDSLLSFGIFFVFSLQPLLWILSVSPIFNKDGLSFLPGIGGGEYAQDLGSYWASLFVFNFFGFVLLLTTEGYRSERFSPISFESFFVFSLKYLTACLLFLFFVANPSLITSSDYSTGFLRRDYIQDKGFFFGLFALFPSLKGLPLITSFIIISLKQKNFLSYLIFLLSFIFYLVESSRAVVILSLFLLWGKNFRLSTAKGLLHVFFILGFLLLCYNFVLINRSNNSAGLISNFYYYFESTSSFFKEPLNVLISVFQNISLGFPNLCEAIFSDDIYQKQVQSLGYSYFYLSHSPLPASIDGFRNFFEFEKLKINDYTPFSMISEYYLFFGYLGLFFVLFCLVGFILTFLRSLKYSPFLDPAPLYLGVSVFLFLISTYSIRSCTKLFFVFFIYIFSLFLINKMRRS
jgi:hypothetical protein